VTPNQYGHIIDCVSAQCNAFAGGNINLKPESSDTRELGLVFTPTFIDGFTATVDYFNIRLTGAIGTLPFANVLDQCATTAGPFFCGLIHRGTGGILFGTGPGAGFVTLTNINTGALQTKGMDFEANYTTDLSNWGLGDNGGLSFNFLGTWTKDFINTPFPGAASYNCAGLFGIVCGSITLASPVIPEWRHKLRATWTSPWDFDFSVAWRHISSVSFDGNTNDPSLNAPCGGPCNDKSDAQIDAFNYIDLAVNWTVHEG